MLDLLLGMQIERFWIVIMCCHQIEVTLKAILKAHGFYGVREHSTKSRGAEKVTS